MSSICPQLNTKYQELKDLQSQYVSMCDNFSVNMNYDDIIVFQEKIKNKIDEILENFIAHNIDEINEHTRTYIGEWNIDVFNKLKNHRHIKDIYESYPDKKVFMQTLETDPEINNKEKAEEALWKKGIGLPGGDILYNVEFSQEKKEYHLVSFSVKQIGFKNQATEEEICQKAIDLGLELCPAEVAPLIVLHCSNNYHLHIAMKPIIGPFGYQRTLEVAKWLDGKIILDYSFETRDGWDDYTEFVFRFRKDT